MLDTNLKGLFFTAQAAGRVMRDQDPPGGSIINISSIMGLVGYYDRAAYCSSKAGVVNLSRVLAIEWAPHQIRVNAVCPTFVETPLTQVMFENVAIKTDILARTPGGRLATPEEVAAAIVFLAGPVVAHDHRHGPHHRRRVDGDLSARGAAAPRRTSSSSAAASAGWPPRTGCCARAPGLRVTLIEADRPPGRQDRHRARRRLRHRGGSRFLPRRQAARRRPVR